MAISVGLVDGSGAAINVSIGWVPECVMIFNTEDQDRFDVWFNTVDDEDGDAHGMAAGESIAVSAAVAANTDNGITAYAGSTTASAGFTIGTDISESAKTLQWVAFRSDTGATYHNAAD